MSIPACRAQLSRTRGSHPWEPLTARDSVPMGRPPTRALLGQSSSWAALPAGHCPTCRLHGPVPAPGEPYAPSSRLCTGTFNSGRTGASPCAFHMEGVSDVRPLVGYAETGLQLEAVGTVEAVLPEGQGLSYRHGLGKGRDGSGDGTAGCGRQASLGDLATGTQP